MQHISGLDCLYGEDQHKAYAEVFNSHQLELNSFIAVPTVVKCKQPVHCALKWQDSRKKQES